MIRTPLSKSPFRFRWTVLLTAGCALFAAGCGGGDSKEPVTADSSSFQVADDGDSATSGTNGSGADETAPKAAGNGEPDTPQAAANPGSDSGSGVRSSVSDTGVQGTVTDRNPTQPPTRPPGQLQNFQVPDGDPGQLLSFIQQLENWQPPVAMSQEERFETVQKIMGAQINAAERVLNHPDALDPQRRAAFDVKLSVLNNLHLLGVQESREHLVEFVEAVQDDRDPVLASIGKMMGFNFRVDAVLRKEDADAEMLAPLVDEMKQILKEESHNRQTLEYMGTAALEMLRAGHTEPGRAAVNAIVEAFEDAEEEVATASRSLLEQASIYEVGFDEKRTAFIQSKPDSLQPLLEAVDQLLNHQNAGPTTLTLAAQVADDLERAQQFDAALQIYNKLEAKADEFESEEVQTFATQTVENARKRIGLLDQPLEVQGTKLDGSALDWSKYKDKVVLVNFWSTNDINSLREISNMSQVYELYKDQGLGVVGVNVDADRENVERFFTLQSPLPWTTIFDEANPENRLAEKVGVGMLPFSLLLDRQGKVAALHVSGPRLQEHVAKLLGPAEGQAPEATAPAGAAPAKPSSEAEPIPAQPEGTPAGDAVQEVKPESEAPLAPPKTDGADLRLPAETFFVALFDDEAGDEAADETGDETGLAVDDDSNPYLADPDLDAEELLDFLFDMEDKPSSIQKRPGFAAAVAEAADRLLAADAPEKHKLIAIESKFKFLHQAGVLGDTDADTMLVAFAKSLAEDPREKVAGQARFILLERQVLDGDDLELEQIPQLLAKLQAFFENTPLSEQHLRMASATVRLINRLDDGDLREEHFSTFGSLFAKSESKPLARYGQKIAKSSPSPGGAAADLVGKPLELQGLTALGTDFNWERYRGRVVLVDFWATWCGPCVKELPNVKAAYEKHHEDGLDIVAVNLDKGEKGAEDLARFIEQHKIPWTNLVGDDAQQIAKKYGIRAIPTVLLVDREGKVVATAHKLADVSDKLAELLAEKP